MHMKKNKPLLLNSLEVQILKMALIDWFENNKNEKLHDEAIELLNQIKAMEYIDEKDKCAEWEEIER